VEFVEKAARSHVRQLPIGPDPLPMETQLSGQPVTTPVPVLAYPLADLLDLLAGPASSLNLQARLHRCGKASTAGFQRPAKNLFIFDLPPIPLPGLGFFEINPS